MLGTCGDQPPRWTPAAGSGVSRPTGPSQTARWGVAPRSWGRLRGERGRVVKSGAGPRGPSRAGSVPRSGGHRRKRHVAQDSSRREITSNVSHERWIRLAYGTTGARRTPREVGEVPADAITRRRSRMSPVYFRSPTVRIAKSLNSSRLIPNPERHTAGVREAPTSSTHVEQPSGCIRRGGSEELGRRDADRTGDPDSGRRHAGFSDRCRGTEQETRRRRPKRFVRDGSTRGYARAGPPEVVRVGAIGASPAGGRYVRTQPRAAPTASRCGRLRLA